MIKITFLGTSCMMPTKERNHISTLLNYENENILIDCGEGTQRQLRLANISPAKISKILITHWHGDHILGLPGLLQTIAASNYNKTLEVYGPRKTNYFFNKIFDMFIVNKFKLKFKIKELNEDSIFFENEKFYLTCKKLDHLAPCLGYSFKEKDKRNINIDYVKKFGLTRHPLLGELQKNKTIVFKGKKISPKKATIIKKGKKISFIFDTLLTKSCFELAKDSDLLVCESTFLKEHADKAKIAKHLTANESALIAKKSNVKKLALTHFSQRYRNLKDMEKEVKPIFKNTIFTKDLLEISI